MAKKRFAETKVGKVTNLKWAYITGIKLGYHPVSKQDAFEKILRVIVKGTRFEEHIKDIDNAKQIKRKKK